MLGIIFTGGEGPGPAIVKRLFEGAAKAETQRALLTIAADSGLVAAENAGIRPDWIIGDMDSLDNPARLAEYPAGSVIRHVIDKDYTDTELALSLAWEKGCDAAWLLGGGGGRIDHLFGIRSLFERERFPCRWITATEDIYCIETGLEQMGGGVLGFSLETGALVSVFPLGDGPWKAASNGLKWPLDSVSWNRGFFGLSNVAINGTFSIRTERGRFLVIVPAFQQRSFQNVRFWNDYL